MMRRALLLALASAWSTCAPAQDGAAAASACTKAADVTQAQLLGLWRAEFEGQAQGATLLLEPNPNHAGSLGGGVNRDGARGLVAGDIEDGEFTLEESADGQRISATWLGDVVEGSCGREIRGTWKAEGAAAAQAFVLRKQ
ncbi:MAG TPA: hypothetical protein VLJ58_12140 [Ramlibacter sp.]|nr:hypothetical protein [Ramlibacter sp.]